MPSLRSRCPYAILWLIDKIHSPYVPYYFPIFWLVLWACFVHCHSPGHLGLMSIIIIVLLSIIMLHTSFLTIGLVVLMVTRIYNDYRIVIFYLLMWFVSFCLRNIPAMSGEILDQTPRRIHFCGEHQLLVMKNSSKRAVDVFTGASSFNVYFSCCTLL